MSAIIELNQINEIEFRCLSEYEEEVEKNVERQKNFSELKLNSFNESFAVRKRRISEVCYIKIVNCELKNAANE